MEHNICFKVRVFGTIKVKAGAAKSDITKEVDATSYGLCTGMTTAYSAPLIPLFALRFIDKVV